MAILNNNQLVGASGNQGYNINNSLRFRASASAYLSRTLTTPTDSDVWTFSFWVKRGSLGSTQQIITSSNTIANQCCVEINSSDQLRIFNYIGSAFKTQYVTTQVFRDPSAWYHIVIRQNSSSGFFLYVNGVQVTAFGTATGPDASDWLINQSGRTVNIGREQLSGISPLDGYLAETYFIDGQALTPSSFGETDTTTGVWEPKIYTGTYGTNGFYLKFSDIATTSGSNAGLGKDFSGNGNYYNTNNISVTAGTTYDAMTDVPTNTSATVANYCVGNPNYVPSNFSKLTIINGNLSWGSAATNTVASAAGTMAMTSGQYYWEVTIGAALNTTSIGIQTITATAWRGTGTVLYRSDGQKIIAGTASAYGASYTTNDVLGFAYDADAGTLVCYKNNTSQGTIYSSGAGSSWLPAMHNDNAGSGVTYYHNVNFGQRPFTYTPPTGYKALNTFNLPDSTIKKGNTVMDATLYTGNGSTNAITNAASFKPDFVWGKSRSLAQQHLLFDSVRGTGNYLQSQSTAAEGTDATTLLSFNSNGFTLGSNITINTNASTNVGWQWQAGQGTNTTNTSGTITSTVSVNATAGFSIVTYTGTGANATVGHGLGVAPKMVIVKARTQGTGYNWVVYHSILGATQYLGLNLTNAAATASTVWNNTAPTSTVFSLGNDPAINGNTLPFVAYCWAEIEGFSKFGSYTGNGSADGPFVYTGFRPKFVMYKRTDTTGNWQIEDTSRATYNAANAELFANLSIAEYTTAGVEMDILSNGFKLRNTNADRNANNGTYIYMAFAENPFKNSNAR